MPQTYFLSQVFPFPWIVPHLSFDSAKNWGFTFNSTFPSLLLLLLLPSSPLLLTQPHNLSSCFLYLYGTQSKFLKLDVPDWNSELAFQHTRAKIWTCYHWHRSDLSPTVSYPSHSHLFVPAPKTFLFPEPVKPFSSLTTLCTCCSLCRENSLFLICHLPPFHSSGLYHLLFFNRQEKPHYL